MRFEDSTLTGEYTSVAVDKRVGSGTHWETFVGQTAADKSVVVRRPLDSVDPGSYDRLTDLARQWQQIADRESTHTIVDWGTEPEPWVAVDTPADVDQFATGESITAVAACDPRTKAELIGQVCDIVRTYSRYGSTPHHLAIHPESVTFQRMGDDPLAIVSDWGISRLVDNPPVTPYTAPEQLSGDGHASKRTDVYRLGMLAAHAFGGDPLIPSDEADLSGTIAAGITAPEVAEAVPEAVATPISRAIAVDPADRHATMYQLRRDLLGAVSTSADRTVAPLAVAGDTSDQTDTDASKDEAQAAEAGGDAAHNDTATDNATAESTSSDASAESGVTPTSRSLTSRRSVLLVTGAIALHVLIGGVFGAGLVGIGPLAGGGGESDASGTIGGVVYDGPVDGDQSGVADVDVTLLNETQATVDEATTDENGSFTFSDLEAGNYTIHVETEEHEYEQKSDVAPGEELEFTPIPTDAIVSGNVTDAETQDPIEDASVTLLGSDGDEIDSADGGEFAFDIDDADETYSLRVNAGGYEPMNRTVTLDGDKAREDFELTSLASYSGTVVDAESGDGVNVANITLSTTDGEQVELQQSSPGTGDADKGEFDFGELPAGSYEVVVEKDSYETHSDTFELEPGEIREQTIELLQS